MRYPILPSPLYCFAAGFGGSQVLIQLVAVHPSLWVSLIGGAFSIWGLISWRVEYLRRERETAELIARIKARGVINLTIP